MGLISNIKLMICNIYYPFRIKKTAAQCGDRLYVGGKSYVTTNTFLGNGVCFNGMSI